jgi:hypothetical protein
MINYRHKYDSNSHCFVIQVIADWTNKGGVLLIGYELYRLFYTQRESKEKKRSKVSKKTKKVSGFVDLEEEEKEKRRLESI